MVVVVFGFFVGIFTSRTPSHAESAKRSAGPRPPARTSVLLITIDTLRADRLGSYGYDAVETPHIDRLARQGVRFEQVATTAPLTLPAHASILTGQYPFRHGVRDNANFRLAGDALTLAEVLQAAGYTTGAFVGASVLDARTGVAQGFDTYSDLSSPAQGARPPTDRGVERRGQAVVDDALPWIADQRSAFFAWVHLFDPHAPYSPPAPFKERYPGRGYDGEIAYTDAVVGQLLSELGELGRGGDTLVVLTADHGEGLGDHKEQLHSLLVYDSTVRVPLILWAPGRLPEGIIAEGQASLVDLLPTILGLLGIPDPLGSSRDGADLRQRLAAPHTPGRPAYVEAMVPLLQLGWSELRALRTESFKYIAAPNPELYDLRADPHETENLIDRLADRAEAFGSELAVLVADDEVNDLLGCHVVDPDTEARLDALRALGYIGSTAAAPRVEARANPKDDVETLEAFQREALGAERALTDRNWARADEHVAALDEHIPGHPLVHFYRGHSRLMRGDGAGAIADLERTIAETPVNTLARLDLADAYRTTGDTERAYDVLRSASEDFPNFVGFHVRRGAYLEQDGRLDEAEQAYVAAHHVAADNVAVLRRLTNLYMRRDDRDSARKTLERLVEVEPNAADAWTTLAGLLCECGGLTQCEAAWRKAIENAPTRAALHFSLGELLLRQDRIAEATEMFRETLRLDPTYRAAREVLSRIK